MKTKYKWRVSAVLACAVMLLTVSCGSKQEGPASVVDIYRNTAQAYIESGDYESAVKALEEGVAATGDEGLAALLEEAKAAQEAETTDDTNQDETQPTGPDSNDAVDDGAELPADGGGGSDMPTDDTPPSDDSPSDNVEQPDDDQPVPPDDTQPSDDGPSDSPVQSDDGQTTPPDITVEPTEPELPSAEPQVEGQFDDFVGTWEDSNGYGIYLCVGYGDATKQSACAAFYSTYSFVAELETDPSIDEDVSVAYGAVFTGGASVPQYAVELYRYKWWLEAYITNMEDDSEDYVMFYPADMSKNPPKNPFYVG